MLTIWGRLNSHNVKKVAWLAQEIGLPHQRIDMGGPFGFTDDYLAKNPNRLIPTIEVDPLDRTVKLLETLSKQPEERSGWPL